MLPTAGVDKRHGRHKRRGTIRLAGEILHQQRIVRRRIARLARIPRTVHPRGAPERGHLQPRIVRQTPRAFVPRGNRPHFDERIARESVRRLFHAGGIVRHDVVIGQNLADFAYFVRIVRGDVELGTARFVHGRLPLCEWPYFFSARPALNASATFAPRRR